MSELGNKPVQPWFSAKEMKILQAAAKRDRRTVTQFVKLASLDVAAFLLEYGKHPNFWMPDAG